MPSRHTQPAVTQVTDVHGWSGGPGRAGGAGRTDPAAGSWFVERHIAPGRAGTASATADSFGHWQDLLNATYVSLATDRLGTGPFFGQVDNVRCGEMVLSTMVAGGQLVRRTRSHIRRDGEEFLLASVLLTGSGRIEQDDRRAVLSAGSIVFYDSDRPYTLESDGPFRQLVVRVPTTLLPGLDTRRCTARPLGPGTPGAVVAAFLRSLSDTGLDGEDRIAPLATDRKSVV